jgi:hypothetical protein
MTPDRRGHYGLLDAEHLPLYWGEIDQLEIEMGNCGALLIRAIAELRTIRRRAASGDDITSMRNRIREHEHEQERDTWAAAGKRMRAEADAQVEQMTCDRDAHAARAAELARRVSELEEHTAELHKTRTALAISNTTLHETRLGRDRALSDLAAIEARVNTPRADEFFGAVSMEAAHQIQRWGADHDAGKRTEDWITLYTYLLGKAAKAYWSGDQEKLKHHVITAAAVSLNWWRRLVGVSSSMRPGIADPTGAP